MLRNRVKISKKFAQDLGPLIGSCFEFYVTEISILTFSILHVIDMKIEGKIVKKYKLNVLTLSFVKQKKIISKTYNFIVWSNILFGTKYVIAKHYC